MWCDVRSNTRNVGANGSLRPCKQSWETLNLYKISIKSKLWYCLLSVQLVSRYLVDGEMLLLSHLKSSSKTNRSQWVICFVFDLNSCLVRSLEADDDSSWSPRYLCSITGVRAEACDCSDHFGDCWWQMRPFSALMDAWLPWLLPSPAKQQANNGLASLSGYLRLETKELLFWDERVRGLGWFILSLWWTSRTWLLTPEWGSFTFQGVRGALSPGLCLSDN